MMEKKSYGIRLFLHTWIDVSIAATSYIGLHWFCRISKQILPSA